MLSMLPRADRLRELLEVSIETRPQFRARRAIGAGACEHYEIPRRKRVMPKRLTCQALQFVAVHGSFRSAPGNRQTEPSDATAAWSREHGEESIARTSRLGEHSPELGRRVQSLVGREPCVGEQLRAKTKSVKA
jgi:hypothetical protein